MTGTPARGQLVAALALLAFAVVYLVSGLPLAVGTPGRPGPGLVPRGIAVLLLLGTVAHLLETLARPRPRPAGPATGTGRRHHRALAGIVAGTLAYPFILEPLKFVAATAAVAFVMLVLLRPGRPVRSLLLATGLAVAFFVVFSRLLGVALPSGPLEHLLFRVGR